MGSVMEQAKPRLAYFDNLKVALTVLVIVHHVGQAYGPTGGAWAVDTETVRAALLSPFFTVNRSFFMSLFFMISGYFMVAAYERHGFATFLRSRAIRLGVPVLFWAAWQLVWRVAFGAHITNWRDVFDADHLWYLEHLLLFGVVYALWRRLSGRQPLRLKPDGQLPGAGAILLFAAVLAGASFAIRLQFPIDKWSKLLGFFSVAFADVPRDLSFFIIGAAAYKRNWFARYPTRSGLIWLGVGTVAAALWYAYRLWLHARLPGSSEVIVMTYVYPVWEAILCCAMCAGLLVLFREVFNKQGKLARFLAGNQYAAYVLQLIVMVPIQMAFLPVKLGPLAKFGLVSILSVSLIFMLSQVIRKSRLVRSVL